MLQATYNVSLSAPCKVRKREGAPSIPSDEPPELPREIARLFRIQREQLDLTQQLERNMGRIALARAYLARPGSNVLLGSARLARLRDTRRALLAKMRASRIEALELDAFPNLQVDVPETR